jgi:hypothetical protein
VRPGLDPEAENARVARTNPAGSSSRRRPPKPRPDGGGAGVGGDGGTVSAIHLCHSAEGGAGRAVLACREAGLLAGFACVEGARHDPADLHLGVAKPARPLDAVLRESLHSTLQWGVIPQRRTGLSNTLLSVPCPGRPGHRRADRRGRRPAPALDELDADAGADRALAGGGAQHRLDPARLLADDRRLPLPDRLRAVPHRLPEMPPARRRIADRRQRLRREARRLGAAGAG